MSRIDGTCYECITAGEGEVWLNGEFYCDDCLAKMKSQGKDPKLGEKMIPGIAYTLPAHDPVNHPQHYCSHPSGIECITITEHYGFNIGNCIKYLWRAGLKDGSKELEDLKKAAWYLNREIEKRSKK